MRPSTPVTWLFLALVAGVSIAFLVATWRSGDASAEPPAVRARWTAVTTGALNGVRLHSAIGYIAPNDVLAGRAGAIWTARDQKLEAAR
jgi:hypothetical protein